MPKRPTQHETKIQSIRAFEALLPAEWTAQRREEDYGIDYDIEIFRGGSATGLGFHVQLKGTDRLKGKPTAAIKWTTRNYWSAQDKPTLVVLWEAATGTVWAEWSHRVDLFGVDQSATKTFQFPFSVDPWNTETPAAIEEEVTAYRAWREAKYHLPISVIITGEEEIAGLPTGLVIAKLRRCLWDYHAIVKVRREAGGVLTIDLRIGRNETVLWLSGGPSTVLHHGGLERITNPKGQKALAEMLAADLTLLIAYQLGRLGLERENALLVGSVVDRASLVNRPEVASSLIHLLCEQDRTSDAIHLAQCLLYRGAEDSSIVVPLSLMDAASGMDLAQRRQVADALVRWGNECQVAGQPAFGASFVYNASRVIGVDDNTRTLELLDRAAQLDGAYRQRPYWWRERAGSLFLSNDFSGAVADYQRAVDLGMREALPLLADAELMSGNYAAALQILLEVEADPALRQPEWRLKALALSSIMDWTAIDYQVRQPKAAASLLSSGAAEPGLLLDVLQLDLLNGEALFELGDEAQSSNAPSLSLHLLSALVEPTVPVAWLRCLAGAAAEAPDLLDDVAACASRWARDDLLDMLLSDPRSASLATILEEHFDGLPDEPETAPVARMVSTGSAAFMVVERPRRGETPDAPTKDPPERPDSP